MLSKYNAMSSVDRQPKKASLEAGAEVEVYFSDEDVWKKAVVRHPGSSKAGDLLCIQYFSGKIACLPNKKKLRRVISNPQAFQLKHYQALLVWLYTIVCPELLPDIHKHLQQNRGKEEQLVNEVCIKFYLDKNMVLEKLHEIKKSEENDPIGVANAAKQFWNSFSGANNLASKNHNVYDVCSWSFERVALWLSDTLGLFDYVAIFRKERIDGSILLQIDDVILDELKIFDREHRKKILDGVDALLKKQTTAHLLPENIKKIQLAQENENALRKQIRRLYKAGSVTANEMAIIIKANERAHSAEVTECMKTPIKGSTSINKSVERISCGFDVEVSRCQLFKNVLSATIIEEGTVRQLTYSGGVPEEGKFRGIIWKLLLEFLPWDSKMWMSELGRKRSIYQTLVKEYLNDPKDKYVGDGGLEARALQLERNTDVTDTKNIENKTNCDDKAKDIKSNKSSTVDNDSKKGSAVVNNTSKNVKYTAQTPFVPPIGEEVSKDVERTAPGIHLYETDPATRRALHRILCIFAKLHPRLSYVQGMNELAAVLYFVFLREVGYSPLKPPPILQMKHVEADTFFCFSSLMVDIGCLFTKKLDDSTDGIKGILQKLDELVKRHDKILADHLSKQGISAELFAFRWITTVLTREFDLPDVLRLWDSILADPQRDSMRFLLYICTAMILHLRSDLLNMDFIAATQLLMNFPPTNIDDLVDVADRLMAVDESLAIKSKGVNKGPVPASPGMKSLTSQSIKRSSEKNTGNNVSGLQLISNQVQGFNNAQLLFSSGAISNDRLEKVLCALKEAECTSSAIPSLQAREAYAKGKITSEEYHRILDAQDKAEKAEKAEIGEAMPKYPGAFRVIKKKYSPRCHGIDDTEYDSMTDDSSTTEYLYDHSAESSSTDDFACTLSTFRESSDGNIVSD